LDDRGLDERRGYRGVARLKPPYPLGLLPTHHACHRRRLATADNTPTRTTHTALPHSPPHTRPHPTPRPTNHQAMYPIPRFPAAHTSAAFEAMAVRKSLILTPPEIYAECAHHGALVLDCVWGVCGGGTCACRLHPAEVAPTALTCFQLQPHPPTRNPPPKKTSKTTRRGEGPARVAQDADADHDRRVLRRVWVLPVPAGWRQHRTVSGWLGGSG
jgi:hypothetical protein